MHRKALHPVACGMPQCVSVEDGGGDAFSVEDGGGDAFSVEDGGGDAFSWASYIIDNGFSLESGLKELV